MVLFSISFSDGSTKAVRRRTIVFKVFNSKTSECFNDFEICFKSDVNVRILLKRKNILKSMTFFYKIFFNTKLKIKYF